MTRNLTPRATGEGSIGTSIKKWLEGWFGTVNATTVVVSGNVSAGTYTGDGSALTGIASGTGGVINTGSTTIGADSDANGSGEIALQIGGVTKATLGNNGNLGIGVTPTARNNTRLQIVDGIGFPAAQVPSTDPNTMDDYEEGTWTPSLTFNTPGDLSVTYSYQTGTYTKIGRKVTVHLTVSTATFTHTTAASFLKITGLPFSAQSITNHTFSAACAAFGGVTKANYTSFGFYAVGGAELIGEASGSAQGYAYITAADLPTGTNKFFSVTVSYIV